MSIRFLPAKTLISLALVMTCSDVAAGEWSLSLGVGKSNASFENHTDVEIQTDESDTSLHLGIGYEFYDDLSLNLSWIDLGQAEATFTASTTDPGSLQRDNRSNVPVLGDGIALSLAYDFYSVKGFTFFAELGSYSWEADLNSEANGQAVSTEIDGTDIFFGLGADYKVSEQVESHFKVIRYNLAPNNVFEWHVGFTYFL